MTQLFDMISKPYMSVDFSGLTEQVGQCGLGHELCRSYFNCGKPRFLLWPVDLVQT